jgi:hypothetical protein
MKYFASLFFIALFSLSLAAQIITPAEKPSEEKAEVWRNFAPVGEQFSLEVPGEALPGFV